MQTGQGHVAYSVVEDKLKELPLLGRLPPDEVARRTGRSKNAVTVKRNRHGILNRFDGRRNPSFP